MTCPICGTVAVPGANFCHNCGAALPGAADLPQSERRTVTVLFGDLSDFTSWSEELDPERVGAVTDRVMSALAGAVKTFGGHVDKLTGDGIMAVFGAPVAHEDDVERAVRAALSMQRAVRRVLDDERGGGAPLGLRVGLNSGEVIAGVQAGLEYTVIGDTVNTAARLADAAAIGAVYAGARTASATRHLAGWRELRPLRLKGKRDPVETFELLGLHDAPGTRSGIGDEASFVGREADLGRIIGRLAEVIDRGEPRVLVMTAEAGIGKTRFAAEVERYAAGYDIGPGRFPARTGARVLSVHCAAFGERRRLAPMADLVRTAIGLPVDVGSTAHTRSAVEERLRRLKGRLAARMAPGQPIPQIPTEQLLVLLGVAADPASVVPAISDGITEPADGEDRASVDIKVLAAAVAQVLTMLTLESPLVVIVDDLHDATPETVDALGVMLEELEGPVLVVLLGRPELVRTAGLLTRLADAEVQALPSLRGADAARLLSSYLRGGRLPQADEDRLLATAQGNPFYLAELVTLLMERGALTRGPATGRGTSTSRVVDGEGGAQWRLTPGSLDTRLLSRDLAAVLAARIDALPADARSVLRDAAVVGDSTPAGALEALRERRSGRDGRPAAVVAVELDRAIDELLARRMLRRQRGGYAFATPLLREAAYAGISKADLAERHAFLTQWAARGLLADGVGQRTADGVEPWIAPSGRALPPSLVGFSDEARDEFIAEHAERAAFLADAIRLRPDSPARSVAALGVAALGRSATRSTHDGEPASALDLTARARQLATTGSIPMPVQIWLVHTRALLQAGRPAEALVDAEKIAANAGDDGRARAAALLLAGRAHREMGDPARGSECWHEALTVATAVDAPAERAEAMRRLGMADFLNGRLADAGSRFTAAFQVAVAAGDRRSQAWSLQNLAWVTTTRGDFAGADAALARSARLFAELHDPVGRAWLRGALAFNRLLAGRLRDAQRLARVFLPFGERVGEVWAVGTLRAVDAYAAAELGQLDSADRDARRAYRDFAAANDLWGRGFALVVRGVIARGLNELGHAADLLSDALAYGERVNHPLLLGMAGTIRGFISLQQGDPEGAEQDARRVITLTRAHGVLDSAQVGPRALLGAAHLANGRVGEALEMLRPLAETPHAPSMLFARRQAVALYARALLAAGRPAEALEQAQLAMRLPADDERSRISAERVLVACESAMGYPITSVSG